MSTTFPQSVQNFPVMEDLGTNDIALVKSYQNAVMNGNFESAAAYLSQIQNYSNKLITSDYINTIIDTLVAVQQFYLQKFSPAYIVSTSQPADQEVGDFWFKVVS